jgi:glycine cleavage system regulatory protein
MLNPFSRPLGVFISSRMDELSLDRAVAYRAVAERRYQPVLFEREPAVGMRNDVILDRMNRMLQSCEGFVGIYYQNPGKPGSPYGGLSPIEYELVGYLCRCNGIPEKDWRSQIQEEAARKALIDLLVSACKGKPPSSLKILLKTQRTIDGPYAVDRNEEKRLASGTHPEDIDTFFRNAPAYHDSCIKRLIVDGELAGNNTRIYHHTSSLYKHIRNLLEEPRRSVTHMRRTFDLDFYGPDYRGLLLQVAEFFFEKGINIERLCHTSGHRQVHVNLSGSLYTSDRAGLDMDVDYAQLGSELEIAVAKGAPWHSSGDEPPEETRDKQGKYGYRFRCTRRDQTIPSPTNFKLECAVVDTPGILYQVAEVLLYNNLDIRNVDLGTFPYKGSPQARLRIICTRPARLTKPDFNEIENALLSVIGVNSAVIREWQESSTDDLAPQKRMVLRQKNEEVPEHDH